MSDNHWLDYVQAHTRIMELGRQPSMGHRILGWARDAGYCPVNATWLVVHDLDTDRYQFQADPERIAAHWAKVRNPVTSDIPARSCLRCGKDLTDETGVLVFVAGKPMPDNVLLCVEHGANGRNAISPDEYKRLTNE